MGTIELLCIKWLKSVAQRIEIDKKIIQHSEKIFF
jgi:hypothetical protein